MKIEFKVTHKVFLTKYNLVKFFSNWITWTAYHVLIKKIILIESFNKILDTIFFSFDGLGF